MGALALLGPALSLGAVYAAACAYLYKAQLRLLFPGDGLPFGAFDGLTAFGGEAVRVEQDGQVLRYYKVEPRGAQPKAWVLHFHGNRDGARERLDFAEHFSAWGYSAMLAEFPGYAGDPVRGDQRRLLRNGLAMADEALRQAQGRPLFVFGESLGSAVATYVAMRRRVAGLLLSTPFTSLAAVAQGRYPLLPIRRLITDPMPASRWAPHVSCPVLIVHGTQDKVVPFKLGRAEALNFNEAPAFVAIEGPGHSDIRDRFPQQYWGAYQAFMARCLSSESSRQGLEA